MKSDDIRILRDIEQYYSTQIDEMPMNGKLLSKSVLVVFYLLIQYLNAVLIFFAVADLI